MWLWPHLRSPCLGWMPQGGITRSQENIFQVFATYSQTLSQGYFGAVGKPFQKKRVTLQEQRTAEIMALLGWGLSWSPLTLSSKWWHSSRTWRLESFIEFPCNAIMLRKHRARPLLEQVSAHLATSLLSSFYYFKCQMHFASSLFGL